MFLVESKGAAIICMLLALLFLGTWPAILTQLERRGRLPQHTYLDYSIANFLTAVVIALTVGQIGDGKPNMPNFIDQLSQDNWPCVLMAMAGGVFLSLGNASIQYALALVGLSVTEVVTSSLAVVLGTTLNYFLDDRINRAEILFPGVGCFLIAVCLGAVVHSSNAADNAAKLEDLSNDQEAGGGGEVVISDYNETLLYKEGIIFTIRLKQSYQLLCSKILLPTLDGVKDVEDGSNNEEKAKVGSAQNLIDVENNRAIKVFGRSIWLGLSITFFGGICYSLFSPAFNLATNDQWHMMKRGVPKLVIYTAFFYFSISFFVVAVVLNLCFLYRPILNSPKSSLISYYKDCNGRNLALLAGLFCALGNGLQFMGGQAAGYAAADCVQALPLVSTFWGIVFCGEYRRSSRRTYILLVSMLFMFIVAVAVLMASSGQRKSSSNE